MVHLGGVYATSTLLAPQLLNPLGEHVVALPVAHSQLRLCCGPAGVPVRRCTPAEPSRGGWG